MRCASSPVVKSALEDSGTYRIHGEEPHRGYRGLGRGHLVELRVKGEIGLAAKGERLQKVKVRFVD